MLRTLPVFLMIAALACEAFSWWGLNTVSGRSTFDEMAGIIPLAAALLGLLLGLAASILWWRARQIRRD